MDRWFVPSVRHTGSHFVRAATNNGCTVGPKVEPGLVVVRDGMNLAHFYPDRADEILFVMRELKTVIPLRHPALVAASWKRRRERVHHWNPTQTRFFGQEWALMESLCKEADVFFFPLDQMPFDKLETYLGRKVRRTRVVLNSIGDYPEKHTLEAAREYLGREWAEVEDVLSMPIARRYYDNPVRRLR